MLDIWWIILITVKNVKKDALIWKLLAYSDNLLFGTLSKSSYVDLKKNEDCFFCYI